jgi:hypothetical protein
VKTRLLRNLCVDLRDSLCDVPSGTPRRYPSIALTVRKIVVPICFLDKKTFDIPIGRIRHEDERGTHFT